MSQFTDRRARKQHELERNFVRMPHRQTPANPKRNRSSIVLPEFHGVSFRIIGKHRRSVYHQLDGSIELADNCKCIFHTWDEDFGKAWVERISGCPIDQHSMRANRESLGDAA